MEDFGELKKIGEFEVESGFINVTDPCYESGTWCGSFNLPAKNGKWVAQISCSDCKDWGIRVRYLVVSHSGTSGFELTSVENIDCGVDSGQLGVFDSKYYQDNKIGKSQLKNSNSIEKIRSFRDSGCEDWYIMCCDREEKAKIIPFGVVSDTGFGDGNYRASFSKDKEGNIRQVLVMFIEDEKSDYDENEDPFVDG